MLVAGDAGFEVSRPRPSQGCSPGHHHGGTDGDPAEGIFWPGVLWLHRHGEAFRQRASDVAGVWGSLTHDTDPSPDTTRPEG